MRKTGSSTCTRPCAACNAHAACRTVRPSRHPVVGAAHRREEPRQLEARLHHQHLCTPRYSTAQWQRLCGCMHKTEVDRLMSAGRGAGRFGRVADCLGLLPRVARDHLRSNATSAPGPRIGGISAETQSRSRSRSDARCTRATWHLAVHVAACVRVARTGGTTQRGISAGGRDGPIRGADLCACGVGGSRDAVASRSCSSRVEYVESAAACGQGSSHRPSIGRREVHWFWQRGV